jgi:glycerate dehydrogenase
LDGYTLNPGDLSWDGLAALGDCRVHDRTPPALVVERAAGAEVVLTNKTVLDRELIDALPAMKYIGVLATGYNVVDVAAAAERRIPVTNTPAYGTPAVAQMTFALILELAQQVGHHAGTVREGRWCASPDFCYWDHPLVELQGLTLGIVGYGSIGRAVANIARAFGMKVITYSVPPVSDDSREVRPVDLNTLFREADIVTLHCPLTAENQGMVNASRLALMKPTAMLINTGRGPLVVESDLAEALNSGRLAGAGLDVLAVEPPRRDNPLLAAKNCVITPHIAWATRAARARLMRIAVENVRAFLEGKPTNVVNF